jgi:hypothetical protein
VLKPLLFVTALVGTAQLTACSLATVGENAGAARLPTGVTLLGSNEEECAGIVQIDERSRSGSSRRPLIAVHAGENATFRLDAPTVQWTCVIETSARGDTLECPRGSSHVRITRSSAQEDFLFECYG